ncbi:endonuclease/Exonuclease/phosphatase family protein [Roseibium sp. TrichSKD4]|nr:endonuclease/Exonuclease/phosphatase family protein [Roseibium sp. TrichSKD4]
MASALVMRDAFSLLKHPVHHGLGPLFRRRRAGGAVLEFAHHSLPYSD